MTIELATGECGFCKYIAGITECAFIRRGELVSALVNRTQYEAGAVLIIPNQHWATVLDMPPKTLSVAALESQLIGRALIEAFGATGLNIFQNNGLSANQHVPHYHVHVVPRYPGSDSTRIYLQDEFTPIALAEQHAIARKIEAACAAIESRIAP